MEIAACVLAIDKRVIVQHVQASMGNYELLRVLSKHMPRLLEVLGGANTSESLAGDLGLHGLTKDHLTVCLVTISCPDETASDALRTLHNQFCAIFQTAATGGSRTVHVVAPVKEDPQSLKPEQIFRILSSEAEDLVKFGHAPELLLGLNSPPQVQEDTQPEQVEHKDVLDVSGAVKMRDNQWVENSFSLLKLRIEDVRLFFGMVLESAITTFNKEEGEGECKAKPLSLAQLKSDLHKEGERHLREVVIPEAVSTLLLRPAADATSSEVNQQIASSLEKSRLRDQQMFKFVLLGLPKSGRHTLFKQLRIIYGEGYSNKDREALKASVFATAVEDITAAMKLMKSFPVDLAQQLSSITSLIAFLEKDYMIFLNSAWDGCLHKVLQFWQSTGVLARVQSELSDPAHKITKATVAAAYWLDRMNNLLANNFIPSDQDILRARTRGKSGAIDFEYNFEGSTFRVTLPGQGYRSKCRKWLSQFSDFSALIFFADVSTFNQMLPEDESVNALSASCELFAECVNMLGSTRDRVNNILFLTGKDVLYKQLMNNPSEIAQYFPNAPNYEKLTDEIYAQFYRSLEATEALVYSHFVCTTDTANASAVMEICRDIVIRITLRMVGLLDESPAPPPRRPAAQPAISPYVPPVEKKRKRPQKKEDKVDNVFADMENVFNGLADFVNRFETPLEGPTNKPCLCFFNVDRGNCLRWLSFTPVLLFLVYASITVFAVVVLLPCTFWLLIVRTTKVEREVEAGFAVRQEVLEKETWRQKARRFMSLLRRSIPMNGLLVVWPLVIVLGILPSRPDLALPLIGSQLLAIAVLQLLGCVRGLVSWVQANQALQRRNAALQWAALRATAERAALTLTSPLVACSDAIPLTSPGNSHEAEQSIAIPRLAICRFATWKEMIGIAVEALQLASVALPDGEGPSFTGAILVQPVKFVPVDIQDTVQFYSSLIACVCVLALLLLFCVQLIKEVRTFGKLKHWGEKQAANKFFFHSFVGTIIYGHGEMKGVSCFIKLAVSTLSDALFLIVCANLLRTLTCTGDSCWQGSHAALAAVSLLALSFYVPLCAMIGPLLGEAREGPGSPGDISIAQPFLSVVTIAKFLLLLFVQFFFADNVTASPIASVLICAIMLGGTIFWTFRTGSSLIRSALPPVSGLFLPLSPPVLSIWKTLSFAAGLWGGLVAVVFAFLATSSSSSSLIVLFVGLGVLLVGGFIWASVWSRRENAARRGVIALTLLLEGTEEVDLGLFHRSKLSGRSRDRQAASVANLFSDVLPPKVAGIEADATSRWSLVTSSRLD